MSIRTALEKLTNTKTHIDLVQAGQEYKCETCDSNLIAKRGTLIIHHFAHEHARDCDTWREPKSVWHLLWQDLCLSLHVEVSFQQLHQADIVNKAGTVIEIQNSPMSVPSMKEREDFYQNMIWIMNATSINDPYAGKDVVLFSDGKLAILKVRHEFWLHCKKTVFIHTDYGIFRVLETLGKKYCLTVYVSVHPFLQTWFDGILKNPDTAMSKIPDCYNFSNASIRSSSNGLIVKGTFEDHECRQLKAMEFYWRKYPHRDWFRPTLEYKSEFARLQDAAHALKERQDQIRRDEQAKAWKIKSAKWNQKLKREEDLRIKRWKETQELERKAQRQERRRILDEQHLAESRRLEEEKEKQDKEQRILEKRAAFAALFTPRRHRTLAAK